MGSVRAFQTLFPRQWQCPNVPAYIERRQPQSAQGGNHDMGKILTNAATAIEGFLCRRVHFGRIRVVDKIRTDAIC